jgi:hypothetical protein
MEAFIAANPGLASRFRTTIEFANYTDAELTDILTGLSEAADYELVPESLDKFREILVATPRDSSFGNGRFARNVLEAAIGRHAWRLRDVTAPTTDQLRQILAQDLTDEPDQPPEPDQAADPEPPAERKQPADAEQTAEPEQAAEAVAADQSEQGDQA